MKYLLPFLLTLPFISCIAADIDEPDACESNSISVPSLDGGYAGIVGTRTFGVQTDLSSMVSRLDSYGTVSLDVNQNQIVATNGDLNWIQHITINISPITNTIDYQTQVLADQDVDNPGTLLKLNTLISNENLYHLLKQGTIELDFTVTGVLPSETTNVMHTFCTAADIHVHKSL